MEELQGPSLTASPLISKCAHHGSLHNENKTQLSLGQLELKCCTGLKIAFKKLSFSFSPLKSVVIHPLLNEQTEVTKTKVHTTRLPFFFLTEDT